MPPPISSSPRELFHLSLSPLLISHSNVANHFPDLLASIIVRAYHTSLPGEISQKWKVKSEGQSSLLARLLVRYERSCRRNLRLFLSLLLFDFLRSLGTMNPALQKFILHNLQPLVLGALFLLGLTLWRYPFSFVGVGVLLLLGLVPYVFRTRKEQGQDTKSEEGGTDLGRVPVSACAAIGVMDALGSNLLDGCSEEEQTSASRRGGLSCLIPVRGLVDLRRGAVAPLSGDSFFEEKDKRDSNCYGDSDNPERRGGVLLEWSSDLENLTNLIQQLQDDEEVSDCESVWDIRGDDSSSSIEMSQSSSSSFSTDSSSSSL
jgi:Ca2+/Na+ antiporter